MTYTLALSACVRVCVCMLERGFGCVYVSIARSYTRAVGTCVCMSMSKHVCLFVFM